jgi:hypothetical protein
MKPIRMSQEQTVAIVHKQSSCVSHLINALEYLVDEVFRITFLSFSDHTGCQKSEAKLNTFECKNEPSRVLPIFWHRALTNAHEYDTTVSAMMKRTRVESVCVTSFAM